MNDEIEDAKLEAAIEAREQYEDEEEEFREFDDYLSDDGSADYSDGWRKEI